MSKDKDRDKIKLDKKELWYLPVLILTIASRSGIWLILGPFDNLSNEYPIFGHVDWEKLLSYALQEKFLEKYEDNLKNIGVIRSIKITPEGTEFIRLLK